MHLPRLVAALLLGAGTAAGAPVAAPPPTLADVAYGNEPRQKLDFWRPKSTSPTPVVVYLHPGAWVRGDKNEATEVARYLKAGIAVVSINYRFVWEARAAGAVPPVRWPLEDAARAVQFVRQQARAWGIDDTKVAATGESAGAFAALWLALHPDLAQPRNADPVLRQSTRLSCVAVTGAQTTLDPILMEEWMPNSFYGGHAFGIVKEDTALDLGDFTRFRARREEFLPAIRAYSPYDHVSRDDPPVFLAYRVAPAIGRVQDDPTHSANFGLKLAEKLREAGVEVILYYPEAPGVKYRTPADFLIAKLGQRRG